MSRVQRDRVRLEDVARAVRVSAMTVSNVLNDRGRVSEGTRARVREAVAALGYAPNLSASRLVGASLSRVGVIYPASDSIFLTGLVAAIAAEAAGRGLQLILRPAPPEEPGLTPLAQEAISAGAEALILIPPFAERVDDEARGAITVPVAGLVTAGPMAGMATARIDNEAASSALTTLLIRAGHRRIGAITGPMDHSDSLARLNGYRQALRDHDLPVEAVLEAPGDFGFTSGIAGAERLLALPEPPTAILAANDEMAAGALWVLNSRGLRVPDDMAVCGFDDTLLATRVWPTLTTVRQPLAALAGQALEDLMKAFRNRGSPFTGADTVLPFELIERGSTRSD